jgi:hypothetical protein
MSLLQKKFQTLVQFFNDKKLHIQWELCTPQLEP